MNRLAAALLLAPLSLSAQPADDWFRAFQYTPETVRLRGCAECAGEADDVCEVQRGFQTRRLEEYAHGRWPAKGRQKLLRPSADPDCAVSDAARGSVELAAVRLAGGPPSEALAQRALVASAVRGWPRAPGKKRGGETAPLDRAALRPGLVCWPAEKGWPAPAAVATDARAALDAKNRCEWWLLSVQARSGEPELGGASFPLTSEAFAYGDPRWRRAFEPGSPLDESMFLGDAAAPEKQARTAPPEAKAPPGRCSEAAAARPSTLDRFEQWEARIRGKQGAPSLDRQAFTLDAAAWSGHCQELEVLRAVVEEQLGCALKQEGRCASAAGQERAP